jgi:hypothetical protein
MRHRRFPLIGRARSSIINASCSGRRASCAAVEVLVLRNGNTGLSPGDAGRHGPGWKERAMAAGPLILEYGRRLRELESRVSRIERHLKPNPPNLLDWPPIRLLKTDKREPRSK